MKISLNYPLEDQPYCWKNMYDLLRFSFMDCGHELVIKPEDAEIIIVIQSFPKGMQKESGKKYILIQTEQRTNPKLNPPYDVEHYYGIADEIWGFDIENKKEKYFVLGYHPYLEITEKEFEKSINICFYGGLTLRRLKFFSMVRNKPSVLNTWNHYEKIKNIRSSKIVLNYKSYEQSSYTEWERLCVALSNKAFILSELFYCPLMIKQFSNKAEYDDNVDYYIDHVNEREEIANNLYEEYKNKLDMRNILVKMLK